jgi:predicted DNA binding protein
MSIEENIILRFRLAWEYVEAVLEKELTPREKQYFIAAVKEGFY